MTNSSASDCKSNLAVASVHDCRLVADQQIRSGTGQHDPGTISDAPTNATETASKVDKTSADGAKADGVDSISKDLREKCETIRELHQAADHHEIEARYEISLICLEVKNSDQYGDGAIEKLAGALGWSKTTLYDYAKVAEAWNTKEEALAAANEMNCGWRHLVEVSYASEEERSGLINAVRDEGMSLQALKTAARKKPAAPAAPVSPTPSTMDTTSSVALIEALQDVAGVVTYLEDHSIRHADRLAAAGARAQPTDIAPEYQKQLKDVRRRLDNVYAKVTKAIEVCLATGKKRKAERKTTTTVADDDVPLEVEAA